MFSRIFWLVRFTVVAKTADLQATLATTTKPAAKHECVSSIPNSAKLILKWVSCFTPSQLETDHIACCLHSRLPGILEQLTAIASQQR